MIPWITFLAALAVIFVLAQQLRHTSDREASNYRELVDLLMKDRDAAREEAHAMRIALFPRLAMVESSCRAKIQSQPQPETPKQPEKPLTVLEKVNVVRQNRKLSTREKMKQIAALFNSKQSRIDQVNDMAERAAEAQQVQSEKPTEERPA